MSWRFIVIGLVFLALFMYLYGFYKQEGVWYLIVISASRQS